MKEEPVISGISEVIRHFYKIPFFRNQLNELDANTAVTETGRPAFRLTSV